MGFRWLGRLRRRKRGIQHRFAPMVEVERPEHRFYVEFLQPGMTVFDVGANVGMCTLLFSRLVRDSGSVHAFEACRATFDRLSRICELAACRNVVLNALAVADAPGHVTLHIYDEEHSSWNTLADRPLEKYGINVHALRKDVVPATTIDAYAHERNIPSIDLLKIDVEGAEYQVLLGAESMFAQKRVQCCIFEYGQTTLDMGNKASDIQSFFSRHGYRLTNVVGDDRVFPGSESTGVARFSIHVAVSER